MTQLRLPDIPALLSVLFLTAMAVQAEDYAIGPGDRIDVSVMSRPDLSRVYRVRLDGSISLHIIGSIPAAGRTPVELEALLEDRLGEVLEGATSTTVEVAEYRPVIVGGEVAAPGAYPFQAGLDVAGAVALAGGLYRLADAADVNAQMRVEAEAARYDVLRARLAARLVERARLVAERDGDADIVVPEEAQVGSDPLIADLEDTQTALRAAREQQLALRISVEEARMGLATREADAYAERQELIRRQLAATLEELEAQQDLAERGLARTERLLDLRVDADRFRADELEALALEAEARQRISDAEVGREAATVSRDRSLAEELAALDAEILETRADMDQARRFVEIFAGRSLLGDMVGAETVYSIRRRGADGVTVVAAAPDTELRPGDMVEVAFAPGDRAEGPAEE